VGTKMRKDAEKPLKWKGKNEKRPKKQENHTEKDRKWRKM